MELVCGFDVETTGLNPKEDSIIEIGAVLFDANTWEVKDTFSRLVEPRIYPIPEAIEKLTGITTAELKEHALPAERVVVDFGNFASGTKGNVAYNAEFDAAFMMNYFGYNVYPYACAMQDLETNVGKKCWKLTHLALDYGLTVDGSKAHRALDDVLIMGQILRASGQTFADLLEYRNEPFIYLKANTIKPWEDNGVTVAAAKKDGYRWEKWDESSPVFTKTWIKKIKKKNLEKERSYDPGFKREVISDTP